MIFAALAQLLALVPASTTLPPGVATLEAQGRYDEASRVLETSASHAPGAAAPWLLRAVAFRAALGELGGVAEDLDALRRSGAASSSLAPVMLDVIDDLGGALSARSRARLVAGCLRRSGLCRGRGERWRAWQLLGDAERAEGPIARAERAYATAGRLAASWAEHLRTREGLLALRHARFMAAAAPVFRGRALERRWRRWAVRVYGPWVRQRLQEVEAFSTMLHPPAVLREEVAARMSVESAALLAELHERACLIASRRLISPVIEANPVLLEAYLSSRCGEREDDATRRRRCATGYSLCELTAIRAGEPSPWLSWCAERRAAAHGPLSPLYDEITPTVRARE